MYNSDNAEWSFDFDELGEVALGDNDDNNAIISITSHLFLALSTFSSDDSRLEKEAARPLLARDC